MATAEEHGSQLEPSHFSIVELIDYEAQMARDSLAEPETLKIRDHKMRRLVSGANKVTSLRFWINELRGNEDPWPGTQAKGIYDSLVLAAIILGVLSGVGLIEGLLRYDGSQPVNIIPILAVYAALQILLLLNYIFKAFVYRAFKRLPGGALIYFIRSFAERWFHKKQRLSADPALQKAALRAFLQRMNQLHRQLLQNHAWCLLQIFGIACHGASLVTFLALIFFNDYTFGWRTTLQLEPELLHQIIKTLAFPFQMLGDFASPNLDVIRASQFSRFQKAFVEANGTDLSARLTAAWWPFLALVIATYALIPRIILWALLRRSIAKELRSQRFDDFRSEALWSRLREEDVSWAHSDSLQSVTPVPDQKLFELSEAELKDCVLLLWRDVPFAIKEIELFLKKDFGLQSVGSMKGSGLPRESEELRQLLRSKDKLTLVLVSDPWELPGEAIDKLRKIIRSEERKSLLILFAPLEKREGALRLAGDRLAWQHALQIYKDPFLGLLEARS